MNPRMILFAMILGMILFGAIAMYQILSHPSYKMGWQQRMERVNEGLKDQFAPPR